MVIWLLYQLIQCRYVLLSVWMGLVFSKSMWFSHLQWPLISVSCSLCSVCSFPTLVCLLLNGQPPWPSADIHSRLPTNDTSEEVGSLLLKQFRHLKTNYLRVFTFWIHVTWTLFFFTGVRIKMINFSNTSQKSILTWFLKRIAICSHIFEPGYYWLNNGI